VYSRHLNANVHWSVIRNAKIYVVYDVGLNLYTIGRVFLDTDTVILASASLYKA